MLLHQLVELVFKLNPAKIGCNNFSPFTLFHIYTLVCTSVVFYKIPLFPLFELKLLNFTIVLFQQFIIFLVLL